MIVPKCIKHKQKLLAQIILVETSGNFARACAQTNFKECCIQIVSFNSIETVIAFKMRIEVFLESRFSQKPRGMLP